MQDSSRSVLITKVEQCECEAVERGEYEPELRRGSTGVLLDGEELAKRLLLLQGLGEHATSLLQDVLGQIDEAQEKLTRREALVRRDADLAPERRFLRSEDLCNLDREWQEHKDWLRQLRRAERTLQGLLKAFDRRAFIYGRCVELLRQELERERLHTRPLPVRRPQ